ncbi:MAG TPA: PilZ domain-containing protein [Polyangiaceae bacterium]|jgi:uncharacterized protein (TIGR02266 family)|nr:PilZ domain-containing protein [Polyangiaceae bacterium]
METTAQRRNNQRFQVDLELTLQSESTIWIGQLENVSDGGVFVASKELKPIGTEVEVTLKLPGNLLPIWAVGVVCWIRDTSGRDDTPLGMGIQFRLIADDALRRIRDFVRERQSATAGLVQQAVPWTTGPKRS